MLSEPENEALIGSQMGESSSSVSIDVERISFGGKVRVFSRSLPPFVGIVVEFLDLVFIFRFFFWILI